MNMDKEVDAWYAANTDELDTEIMNAILSNHAFSLIEDELVEEIRADMGPELDDDFGDVYWNGRIFVNKPGDYYGRDYYW